MLPETSEIQAKFGAVHESPQWPVAIHCKLNRKTASEVMFQLGAGRRSNSMGVRDQDAAWWHAAVVLVIQHGADHGQACLQHIQEQLRERDT